MIWSWKQLPSVNLTRIEVIRKKGHKKFGLKSAIWQLWQASMKFRAGYGWGGNPAYRSADRFISIQFKFQAKLSYQAYPLSIYILQVWYFPTFQLESSVFLRKFLLQCRNRSNILRILYSAGCFTSCSHLVDGL